MGPLSKIWTGVELDGLSQEDSVEVDLKAIQEFVEQTVLCWDKHRILFPTTVGTNNFTTAK